ncbi:MAG: ATP-binding protein [Streptococcaceae bacterium]|jgi:AAA15 family ATPase/GTPase|nr:ATP-binding protein [Streptococcaceae bacterium]
MITKIKLKTGLEFEPSNVNIIVGPNNAGKSTFLTDIKNEISEPDFINNMVVIDEIEVNKFSEREAIDFFNTRGKSFIHPTNQQAQEAMGGYLFFRGNLNNWRQYTQSQIINSLVLGEDIKIRYGVVEAITTRILDGQSRLNGLWPQKFSIKFEEDDESSNLEKMYNSKELKKEFSDNVFESLGLYPEILVMNDGRAELSLLDIPLAMDEEFSFKREVIQKLEEGKRQKDVSDGIKALIGILLELIVGDPEIILIDEVEEFLHAPLARKLGQIVSRIAREKNKQVFVTTHNTNFIMGCIDSHSDFNILRLTYDDVSGDAKLIENDELKRIVKNPLLRSTGVFEGLFFKNVVVCEADSDRVFYQEINYRLLEAKNSRGIEDCLFVNARNKQTVGEITQLLRRFGIPAASVIDFDFIKEGGQVFTKYLQQNGIPREMNTGISSKKTILRNLYLKPEDERKDDKDKWRSELKSLGIGYLEDGNKELAESLLADVNRYGLFPVYVGEVEQWLKNISANGHGNNWVIEKLGGMGEDNTSANYTKPTDDDVWKFMSEIKKWLSNPNKKGMYFCEI